jgi:hypothetical protein
MEFCHLNIFYLIALGPSCSCCILIAYTEDFFILSQFPKLEERKCFKLSCLLGESSYGFHLSYTEVHTFDVLLPLMSSKCMGFGLIAATLRNLVL